MRAWVPLTLQPVGDAPLGSPRNPATLTPTGDDRARHSMTWLAAGETAPTRSSQRSKTWRCVDTAHTAEAAWCAPHHHAGARGSGARVGARVLWTIVQVQRSKNSHTPQQRLHDAAL